MDAINKIRAVQIGDLCRIKESLALEWHPRRKKSYKRELERLWRITSALTDSNSICCVDCVYSPDPRDLKIKTTMCWDDLELAE